MSTHQTSAKPRSSKCRHFCFPFDSHNYCPTCRESGKGDNPCVTKVSPCNICDSFSEEQLIKIKHRRLPLHPHPPKLKEVPKVLPQVTSVSVRLLSLRTSHSPSGLYNDCKRGEADGPVKGNQTSSVPGRLADQGPVSGRSTNKHSDSGRPNSILRVDNKSGEVRTKT